MKDNMAAVQETFAQLNRQFGVMNIKQLNELSPLKDDIVSTGIIGLDIALGVGGIKKGSIVEIYAPESAGKPHWHYSYVNSIRRRNLYYT